MTRRIAGSLAGVVALAALVFGVPTLLWTVGSDLLPDHIPHLSEVWTALTTQDSGRLFIGALLLLCTVAWLLLMVVLLLEIPAALAGRQRRPVRGLTWAQRTASVLLFLILTGTVTSTAAVAQPRPPLTAVAPMGLTSPATTPGSATLPTPTSMPTAAMPEVAAAQTATWTVSPGDTLWSIAEKTLHSGERAGEILALNAHVVQPDGGVLSPTSYPRPGWVLQLPADATTAPTTSTPPPTEVVVEPGDSLAGIAERELGDEGLYPQLAAENGIVDPDVIYPGQVIRIPQTTGTDQQPAAAAAVSGSAEVVVEPGDSLAGIAERELGDEGLYPQLAAENGIVDPDVIYPGQIIRIPQTAPNAPTEAPTAETSPQEIAETSTPPDTADTVPPATPTPAPPLSPTSDATDPGAAEVPAAPPSTASTPAASTPAASTPAASTPAASTPAASTPAASTPAAPVGAVSGGVDEDATIAPYLGLTAAAAAAAAFGLAVARRRGSQRRLPGRQASRPPLAAALAETAIRDRAATVDMAWLDLALRSLGTVLAVPGATIPDITAAYLSRDGLRLQLSTAEPAPAPFVTDGETWWLPATADLPVLALGAVDQLTPLPTLTSIGSRADETVLVDLERLGTIQLDGPAEECRALLTHIAVETAHQTWCDGIDVVLVGWGADLTALNPDRLTYVADLPSVAAGIVDRAGAVDRALTDLGLTAQQARVRADGDSWIPQILLVDGSALTDPTVVQQLVDLSRRPSTTAFVITGDELPALPGATRIHLADGALTLPAVLGPLETITAAAVTDVEVRHLLDLHGAAGQVDQPIPPSTRDESWARHMDESGALIPTIEIPEPVDLWAAGSSPDPVELPQQRAREAAPQRIPAAADVAKLHSVLAADPTLDADLAEWHSDEIRRPRIAVLGDVVVQGSGMLKGQPKWAEIATYLALHPRGVRHEKYGEDLFAGRATGTRRQALHKTRVWLGHDPLTDSPYIPLSNDGLRLTGHLLDSELFARLRVRGDAKAAAGDPTALEDYLAALRLVRGPILPEASTKTGWKWLHNPECGDHRTLPQHVVDAAHRAVKVALAVDDLDNAKWAADLAHGIDVDDPTPMVDLLIIAATAGDMAAANFLAWRVLDAHQKFAGSGGVFELEDLPYETFKVIDRVFPTGLRAPTREAMSR